jgi:hypothetical protein
LHRALTRAHSGPSTTDVQTDWLCAFLVDLRKRGIASFEPEEAAEDAFGKRIWDLSAATLFHASHGWYMGRNVPGKPVQPLNCAPAAAGFLSGAMTSMTRRHGRDSQLHQGLERQLRERLQRLDPRVTGGEQPIGSDVVTAT